MWYVIQTMAGQEDICLSLCGKRLEQNGVCEFFVPRYIAKKHYRQEWHDKEQVLFPGYFFAITEDVGRVVEVLRDSPRFSRVVRKGDQLAPVTREEQEFLESLMDKDRVVQPSEGFMVGDEVYITEGPLRDWRGRIRKVDRHNRIAYLDVELFGRRTPMQIGFSAVRRFTPEEFEAVRLRNQIMDLAVGDSDDGGIPGDSIQGKAVRIVSGVFQGMSGRLLSADEDSDEWAVQLRLYGDEPARVVFHRAEIEV